MTHGSTVPSVSTARRGPGPVVLTGASVLSAFGRGTEALLAGVLSGRPAFAPVQRFDVSRRRVGVAAAMPGSPDLRTEVVRVVREACEDAGLVVPDRARTPLFLALHVHPDLARAAEADRVRLGPGAFTDAVATESGLSGHEYRSYTAACVAASTAI